jgi:hypothetical protein
MFIKQDQPNCFDSGSEPVTVTRLDTRHDTRHDSTYVSYDSTHVIRDMTHIIRLIS